MQKMEKVFEMKTEETMFYQMLDESLDNILAYQKSKHINWENHYEHFTHELLEMLQKYNFSPEDIKTNLLSRNYDPDRVQYFIEAIGKRRRSLILMSATENNSKVGDAVVDLDWKVKLVLGTSSLHEMEYPVTELSFTTVNSRSETATQTFEFTNTELEKLISALEKSL